MYSLTETYEVAYDFDGKQWVIIYPGGTGEGYTLKKNAVKNARKAAKKNKPSELLVRAKDGRVTENRDYYI